MVRISNIKMMRRPCFCLLMLFFVGCTPGEPDAFPDDPMRVLKTKVAAPVPDEMMAERSGKPLSELGRGYAVFTSKCVECHEPRIAVDLGDPTWHPTMRGMSWNAGLEAGDEQALIDYLRAAAEE